MHPDDARLFEAIMKPTRKHPQESLMTQTTQSTIVLTETTDMIEMDYDYEINATANANVPTPTIQATAAVANLNPAGDELIIPDVIRLIEFNYDDTESSEERIIQKSIDDQSREKMEQMPEADWDTSQYDDDIDQHYDVLYEYGDENIAKMTGQVTEVTEATLNLPNEPSDDQYSYSSYSSYDDDAEYYNPDDIIDQPLEDYVQLTTKITTTTTPPPISSTTSSTTTSSTTPTVAVNEIENLSFLRHHSPLPKDIDQNGTCTQINIDFFFFVRSMKHPPTKHIRQYEVHLRLDVKV